MMKTVGNADIYSSVTSVILSRLQCVQLLLFLSIVSHGVTFYGGFLAIRIITASSYTD